MDFFSNIFQNFPYIMETLSLAKAWPNGPELDTGLGFLKLFLIAPFTLAALCIPVIAICMCIGWIVRCWIGKPL